MGKNCSFARKRKNHGVEIMRSTLKKGGFQGGETGQAKTAYVRRKEKKKRLKRRKVSSGRTEESWFHFKSWPNLK